MDEPQPQFNWRPLGQLFVEKGMLTDLRLEHALEYQGENGGRLGEILVALGYVTSTALARVLAEQYGVELALDTGFGTGLRAELERRHDAQGTPLPTGPVLALVEMAPESHPGEALRPLAGLEEQWARLAAADARIADLEQQVTSLSLELRDRDEQVAELAATAAAPRKRRSASAKPKPA